MILNSIENKDPDKHISLTLDYPENKNEFTPLVNTEMKINHNGTLNTRLFRKPQKKLLTLNAESRHPTSVQEHTVANMYKTASDVSSNQENKLYSE